MGTFINTVDIIGDEVLVASLIDRTVEEYADDNCLYVGDYAFQQCMNLKSVNLPMATSLGVDAFRGCSATNINVPAVTDLPDSVFFACKSLTSVTVTSAASVGSSAFSMCNALTKVDLPVAATIKSWAFSSSKAIEAVILRSGKVCNLYNKNAFDSCPAYIYVPAALVDSYKSASNWSNYADRIRALEYYTVDGTISGDLDETKI